MKVKSVKKQGIIYGTISRTKTIKFEKTIGHISSLPARHLRTVINHIINYFGIMSNEWAGAQAFSSFDTLLAPYVYKFYKDQKQRLLKENIDEKTADKIAKEYAERETEQSLQEFLFHVNYPTRYGSQSPFVNITLDLKVPDDMKEQLVIIAGNILVDDNGDNLTYGQLQEFVDIVNKKFFEVYMRGDATGKVFTFPIITVNLTEYFFKELNPEVRNLILKANVRYGATYFQNCVNGYMAGRKLDEGDSRAMCCLHPDTLLLIKEGTDEAEYVPIKYLIRDEDIIEDPDFYVCTPKGFIRPKKIYRIKFSGSLVCIKAYSHKTKTNLELVVTPDHPQPVWYVENGEAKRVIIEAGVIDNRRIYHVEYENTLLPIKSITRKSFKGYVYDLEMPEGHELFYANGVLTHNCRLQIDVKEMLAYSKGLFSAGDYVGSIGVVTLNMAVIGYLAKTKDDLFKLISKWMDIAAESLSLKRKKVIELLKKGLYPFTWSNLPYKNFESHFSTIGYCGLHEGLLNFGIKDGIMSKEGLKFGEEILTFMSNKVKELQDKHNYLFNLEATPAEGASFSLALKAKNSFKDIKLSGSNDTPYLTNSCHLPAEYQGDYVILTECQDKLQPLHSGGTVVHYYIGSELSEETLLNFLKHLAYNTRLPYFTISPVLCVCPVHGVLSGNYDYCPYEHTQEELERYGEFVDGEFKILNKKQ